MDLQEIKEIEDYHLNKDKNNENLRYNVTNE